jgi:DNA polymerase-3 subunit gamma/tau
VALYRKYRPATFAEVVGQEHVTDPLSTALDTGRISHAYLFSGPRGCGKTSSARILARSLNCVEGPTSRPCGVCPSCVALAPGGPGNLDVIELDAASHGGVDDTRELRDRAFYAPAESRYRVFIVDEAHMVTTAGFNALLKIVEEPPAHLIFVFATTEPDKVLPTIRSRTHHYPFRLLPPATMRGLLGGICEQEGVQVEEAVYPLVIRAGGGSPRDSLSVLDQLLAGAGPAGVTYQRALSLLGVTDIALIDDAVEALAAGDGAALFGTIDRVVEAGHDPRRFATDLLERMRDLILLRAVPDAADRNLVTGPGDVLDRMRDQAQRIGPATLARYAELLHGGLGEMRGATAPRLLLEVVCARMLLPAVSDAESATLQRLERLERGMAGGGFTPAAADASPAPASSRPAAAADPSGAPRRRGAEALAAIRAERTGTETLPAAAPDAARSADSGRASMPPSAPGAGPPRSAAPATEQRPHPGQHVQPSTGSELPPPQGDSTVAGSVSAMNPVPAPPAVAADAHTGGPDRDAAGGTQPGATPPPAPTSGAAPAAGSAPQPGPVAPAVPDATGSAPAARTIESAWPDIRTKAREFGGVSLYSMLSGAAVSGADSGAIVFSHPHAALVRRLSTEYADAMRLAVHAVLGRDHEVRWEVGPAGVPAPASGPGGRAKGTTDPGAGRGRPGPARAETPRYTRPSRSQPAEPEAGAVRGQDTGPADPAPAPRFTRPSQARAAAADGGPARGGESRAAAADSGTRSAPPDDDIPLPDGPDYPDDPGLDDYSPVGYDSVPPASTPEEEREMLAESARPVPPGDRRDPDEVALELLRTELGATRLEG